MMSKFLKVPIATSNFINEVYNGGFSPDCSVSMLKEIITLVWEYVHETWKIKAKLEEKYMWNWNMKCFFNETLNFLLKIFKVS